MARPKTAAGIPHLRRQGAATQLIVDGKPMVLLSGEVHNSSASSLPYMEPIWPRMAAMGLNALVVPVYWELVEPREGTFDFRLVDGLLAGARKQRLRLVLLWFGTWKNGESHYAPEWVKTDLARFPRAQTAPGCNSATILCLSDEARDADARALAALMRHLRRVDGRRHTVVAVHVENETGLLGGSRDRSALGDRRFAGRVPAALMRFLARRRDALTDEFRRLWPDAGGRQAGTWTEVFGPAADEVFMAWHIGRYVDRVAEAGKREYPLPMYANTWLVGHDGQRPGEYPSGGPVAGMLNVWQAAAPHIDWIAPDIYRNDFAATCRQYTQSGNPLMIPETHRDERAAANVFYAVGQHDAMCFAPFAIDDLDASHPLAASYALLADLAPLVTAHQGTGRMVGLAQEGGEMVREFDLGGYHLRVQYARPVEPGRVPGCAIIIATGPDEFIVAGCGLTVRFSGLGPEAPNVNFLALDEGRFVRGKWVPGRRLNGDESYPGVVLGSEPCVCRARLYAYA